MKSPIAWLVGVILVATFFYWIAWGWEGTGGYWWRSQAAPVHSSASQPMSGSGLAVLDATDKQQFIGKGFQISNVPIQRKVSNRMFWIGTNSQSPILVVLNSNQNPAQFNSLATGSDVNVAGTVMKAPATPDAASQWTLNDPDLAQLEKDGAYISATQVNRAP
ncbi:MAG: hypothetical protein ACRD25_10650 [Terracidiphilus sp.]